MGISLFVSPRSSTRDSSRRSTSPFVPAVAAGLILALGLITPRVSTAQHLYLDTDGDGVHTASDVLAPTGSTSVDVWLRTDADRDGAPAACSAGDLPLSILGYSFVLHAANGTVSFGGFVNRVPDFTVPLGEGSSATEYANGTAGATPLPPGLYRLASMSVTPASGTPSIEILASSTLPGGQFTAFTSECFGLDFDGILKLGTDWNDADGIPFGGESNHAPALDPIADVTVAEGETAAADLRATDLDGDALTFTLASGPAYASVTTLDPGTGVAQGRLDLAPGFEDAGDASTTVRASDGFLAASATFAVHVENVNRPVTIGEVANQTVREGEVVITRVFADDPDHQDITFGVASGPSFVSLNVLSPRAPAVAEIRLAPDFASAGNHTVVLFATDGSSRAETQFQVAVTERYDYQPPILAAVESAALPAGAVLERPLHGRSGDGDAVTFSLTSGPAFASVATLSTDPAAATGSLLLAPGPNDIGFYEVVVGASDGLRSDQQSLSVTVVPAGKPVPPGPDNFDHSYLSYETGETPQALAVGDLDADGNPDVGVGALDGTLTLYFGSAQGRIVRRQTYTLRGAIYSVAIGDINRDGVADLAVADSVADIVTILPGVGAGLFGKRVDLACGNTTAQVALGDLNNDGNPDVVAANEGEATISVLLGHGDFTFDAQVKYPVGEDPCYSRIADLDRDGLLDVAVANEHSNSISILLGTGGGVLAPHVEYGTALDPRSVTTGDLNEDGILDLAVPAFDAHQISILIGRGDGTFAPHVDFDSHDCPWAITLSDFNRDQHLDVATANVCTHDISVFLGNGTGRFDTRSDIPAGALTRFLRSGDMNRDGRPDLAVCNEGAHTLNVFLGNGDGTFGALASMPVDSTDGSAAVTDLNGDGTPDLAIPLLSGSIGLYWNRGDGTIAASSELPGSGGFRSILTGDWNGDHFVDLVVRSESAGTLAFYRGTGHGAFDAPTQIPLTGRAEGVTSADMDGDEHLDLVVGQGQPNAVVVLRGRGDGTFESQTPFPVAGEPSSLETGDWNADGEPDVAVGLVIIFNPFLYGGEVDVLLGDGAGALTQGPRQATTRQVSDLAFHDADHDGVLDLLVTSFDFFGTLFSIQQVGYLTTLHSDGGGGFVVQGERFVGSDPGSMILRDVDGDARVDVLLRNGRPAGISVMPAVEGGEFGARTTFGSGIIGGVSAADWDGDGDIDVVAAGPDRVVVFRNRGYRAEPALAVRVFTTSENKTIRLMGKKPTFCAQIEPVNESFQLPDVDMATVVLQSPGTGSVEEISAIQGKTVSVADRDRNGVSEIEACFANEGLAALFSGVHGSADVVATVAGRLYSGKRFSAPVALKVVGTPHQALAVGVSPNPMNPAGALTVTMAAAGPLRVTLHDLRGRLVREVARERSVPAGEYRFLVAGGGGRVSLASGIYFFRVEGAGVVRTGKFTVLK
jgi:hypothetical protein